MNKRGLSDVVTTVLIILLALAAIVIIWAFVKPVIFSSGGKIESGLFTINFDIPAEKVFVTEDGNITFRLNRKAGAARLVAVQVVFEDENTLERYVKRINYTGANSLEELGSSIININKGEHG